MFGEINVAPSLAAINDGERAKVSRHIKQITTHSYFTNAKAVRGSSDPK